MHRWKLSENIEYFTGDISSSPVTRRIFVASHLRSARFFCPYLVTLLRATRLLFFRAWRWITLLQSTCSFIRCTQCSQHYCIPHVLHSIVFTVVTPSLCVFIRRRPACFSPKLHYQIVCAFQWKMNFIRRTRKKCDLVSRTSWLAAICRPRFRSIENLIIIGLLSLLHSYLS